MPILLNSLIQDASDRERQLLRILAERESPFEWKAIVNLIKRRYKKFPSVSVGKFLTTLLEKKLLQQPKRGIYKFPDRMFREYVLRLE